MAAEDEIRQDENRPSTDRSEFQRTPLRIHFRNFGRAFTDFDWFGLFRRKREPPSGSQSDRPAVRESSTWPETKQLSIKKAISDYSVQSVCPNEAKDWQFIDDEEKN